MVIKHLPFSPLVLKVNDKMFSLHFIMHDKFPYYRAAKFQLSCLPLFFHFSRNLRYLSLLWFVSAEMKHGGTKVIITLWWAKTVNISDICKCPFARFDHTVCFAVFTMTSLPQVCWNAVSPVVWKFNLIS